MSRNLFTGLIKAFSGTATGAFDDTDGDLSTIHHVDGSQILATGVTVQG